MPRLRQFFSEGFIGKTPQEVTETIRNYQQDDEGDEIGRAFDLLDAVCEYIESEAGIKYTGEPNHSMDAKRKAMTDAATKAGWTPNG